MAKSKKLKTYSHSNWNWNTGTNYSSGYSWYTPTYDYSSYYSRNKYSYNWGEEEDLVIKKDDGYATPSSYSFNSQLKHSTNNNKKVVKNLARYFYHKAFGHTDYIEDKYKKEEELSEAELKEKLVYTNTIEEIKDKFIPGSTPLAKAINVVNELFKEDEGEEDLLKIMANSNLDFKFRSDVYFNKDIDDIIDANDYAKKHKDNILRYISLIKEFGNEFSVEKDTIKTEVHHSNQHDLHKLRRYSKLNKIKLHQRRFPDYQIRVLKKKLKYKRPIVTNERKQSIIIIQDRSGSMFWAEKKQWSYALLIERLEHVMKGNAEIYFSYYLANYSICRFSYVHDKKSALEFFSNYQCYACGGDTNLGNIINRMAIDLEKNTLPGLPNKVKVDDKTETLIICDGQDNAKTDKFKIKSNIVSLYQNNDQFKKLAKDTGGRYIFINSSVIESSNSETVKTLKNV